MIVVSVISICAWLQSVAVYYHSIKTRGMVRRLDIVLLRYMQSLDNAK